MKHALACLLLLTACGTPARTVSLSGGSSSLSKQVESSSRDLTLVTKSKGQVKLQNALADDRNVCGTEINATLYAWRCYPREDVVSVSLRRPGTNQAEIVTITQAVGLCVLLAPICLAGSVPGQ